MEENGKSTEDKLGWWTMSGAAFLKALQMVEAGSTPDEVYIEYYVNSERENLNGKEK